MARWQWLLLVFARKLWLRVTLLGLAGVATAVAGIFLAPYVTDAWTFKIGAKAIDGILNVLASSMLGGDGVLRQHDGCGLWCGDEQRDAPRHASADGGSLLIMNRFFLLILFFVLVIGGGLAIGFLTAPGEWYVELTKPAFNPPNWSFAPVWTILYVLIALAGWRVWQRDRAGWPMKLWWLSLALNFLWSPTFFSAHQVGAALVVILLLLAAILAFIGTAWRRDRVAAWLFVPYAFWVAFASVLNASILALN